VVPANSKNNGIKITAGTTYIPEEKKMENNTEERVEDYIENFTAENLKPLVGQKFSIKDQSNNCIDIELTEVEERQLKGIEGRGFSAYFKTDENAIDSDGTFILEHKKIGHCSLMISLNSATECEVVVCRVKNSVTSAPVPD
jgi:hypothetical protein